MNEETTRCELFYKEYPTVTKRVYIYCEDILEDGNFQFQIDYVNEFVDGHSEEGNAFADLNEVIKAYNAKDYDDLMFIFSTRFFNDENAWEKVIRDMKSKGIDVNEDESETHYGDEGFFMSNL